MSTPPSSIRNIGPAMQQALANVGIHSAEELREMGADAAYLRLLQGGRHRPHFIAYYVIVMGLQGRPWNDCQGTEKAALRKRFDALVAQAAGGRSAKEKGRSDLEAALDALGVVPVRRVTPGRG
ncbi:TfoX/Sxy family DNA transformation protein [Alkalilacustris brevis]|uniref:TfoX/Sxy family DNA transformation protein n=1 Tax=Alkalilacustris brevis TaxID=2026338 RepID=UPI000E0D4435|nr:TfoX/Sxy family DNA transformation protein [Alkalilacustris brevis]